MDAIISLFNAAVVFGTVIMFGAIGEIIAEKSGSLNLGVPGIMYLGGIAGLVGAFFYESSVDEPNRLVCVIIAVLCCFAVSFLGGLIFSFLTITLRANQNVTGLTLTIFGSGVANFFGGSLNKLAGGVGQISVSATSSAFRHGIPGLKSIGGGIGQMFFSYGFLVYIAIASAVLLSIYLKRTRQGLALGAVGENRGRQMRQESTSQNTSILQHVSEQQYQDSAGCSMLWTIQKEHGPMTEQLKLSDGLRLHL